MLSFRWQSLKTGKTGGRLTELRNSSVVIKTIAIISMWLACLIPIWLYIVVMWLFSPLTFWQGFAITIVFLIALGWLQVAFLFIAIGATITLILEDDIRW